jgi:hypothetical protein
LKKEFYEKTVASTLTNVEKRLVARGGQFLVGNALRWAVPNIVRCSDELQNLGGQCCKVPTDCIVRCILCFAVLHSGGQYLFSKMQ